MAGLDHHSKLITPGQFLVLVLVVGVGAIWYFDVDWKGRLFEMRGTIEALMGLLTGGG